MNSSNLAQLTDAASLFVKNLEKMARKKQYNNPDGLKVLCQYIDSVAEIILPYLIGSIRIETKTFILVIKLNNHIQALRKPDLLNIFDHISDIKRTIEEIKIINIDEKFVDEEIIFK